MTHSPKTVLITGCSVCGIGSALALEFHRRGLHVFATTRSFNKMAYLTNLDRVTLLQLDMTSQASIAAAAAQVDKTTGGSLYILTNNSGSQYTTPSMEVKLDAARSMFEVNIFGVAAVYQAFAMFITTAHGTIINVCFISAHVQTPSMGFYSASKTAFEVMSEKIRLEMAPLGVHVISLVPGAVGSNIMTNGATPELPDTSPFKPAAKGMVTLAKDGDCHARMLTETFAKKAVDDVLSDAEGKL
ncbi:hypothetical protein COCMIDRAFT_30838 [Bipolaris oryzae ATCC 44560]|uniref:Uncharacterized protein n=1 Tax=Bipolaris oryzae ATCC 44560 TaxID=930090 RepID=W6YRE7_COCMI|nr:uncharacterized protein COCMIDRAFT_30838 [Bipolaris oryzae ATCC 44560]EUC40180.1 hypothetical protein COCMIDRAFT_30838 [Bipolaris oryzae ATCC 44560]